MCCRYAHERYWLLEGVKWLPGPEWAVKVAGKSGISQARTRLGWEPLKRLHDEVVAPIAVQRTKGAWYRHWRSVSLDGSTMDVADNQDNEKAFGTAGGESGDQRLPASALRVLGGERDARIVWHANERLWTRGNHAGPTRYCPRSKKECCVWQIASSLGLISGKRPVPQAPICSGESKRICVCLVKIRPHAGRWSRGRRCRSRNGQWTCARGGPGHPLAPGRHGKPPWAEKHEDCG